MPSQTKSQGLTVSDIRRTRQKPLKRSLRSRKLDAAEVRTAGNVLEKARYAKIDRRQNERIHYGRSVDLDVIDMALQRAARGNMLSVTDLGREALRLDGHLSGILNKRLNRAGAIDWNVVANDGSGRPDYDRGRARERADFVRAQLLQIPNFRDSLRDLSWAVWDNRACSEVAWSIGTGAEAGDSKLYVGFRPRELCWIHPRRLSFSQQRRVVITDDYDPGSGFLPKGFPVDELPEKFVVSTPRLFNDYPELEGLSIRSQYWSFFQRLGTRERIILVEVFGAPWRLAYSEGDDVGPSDDTMREAFGVLQTMSSRNAAWLPHGTKPFFFTPPAGSGQTHKELIEDARFVLSKLVLGQTSSTDAVPTGLGSSIADTQLTEEDLIIASDLRSTAGVIEHQLTDRIIELNYGPEELIYAPLFEFEIKGQVDRQNEADRLSKTLAMGVPVAVEEVYEVLGYRQPRQGEPVMMLVADDSGIPGAAPRNRIVFAPGNAPPPGELAIEPAEAIKITTDDTDAVPSPKTPGPPALPPNPGVEDPSVDQGPDDSPPEEPTVEAADKPGIIVPYESPSGLTDADRELG